MPSEEAFGGEDRDDARDAGDDVTVPGAASSRTHVPRVAKFAFGMKPVWANPPKLPTFFAGVTPAWANMPDFASNAGMVRAVGAWASASRIPEVTAAWAGLASGANLREIAPHWAGVSGLSRVSKIEPLWMGGFADIARQTGVISAGAGLSKIAAIHKSAKVLAEGFESPALRVGLASALAANVDSVTRIMGGLESRFAVPAGLFLSQFDDVGVRRMADVLGNIPRLSTHALAGMGQEFLDEAGAELRDLVDGDAEFPVSHGGDNLGLIPLIAQAVQSALFAVRDVAERDPVKLKKRGLLLALALSLELTVVMRAGAPEWLDAVNDVVNVPLSLLGLVLAFAAFKKD